MTMHTPSREFAWKNAGARVDDQLELKAVMDALKARDAEIQRFAEKASAEIKATGQIASETKSALEKLSTQGAGLSDRLLAVEQKLARRVGAIESAKSIGEQFTESEDFKILQVKGSGTARLNLKATTITSLTTDANGSAGDLIVPQRLPGIVMPAERQLSIRNLLLPGRTSSNAVEYVEETGFTNAAATVAETGTRAQSDLKFELKTVNVKNIAHWVAASKNILSDVPMLASYIDTRLRYGLAREEEDQLLRGDGTGNNVKGIVHHASLFKETVYSGVGDTRIDTIRRATLQVRVAELRPTFVVMHPQDWAEIELTKDTNDRYIWVNVQQGGTPQMWRLAVVETTAMNADEFLVGATMGAQVFDREDAAVQVSTDHSDFFTRGQVAVRAEERLALAVYRPEAFVLGQFTLGGSPNINI